MDLIADTQAEGGGVIYSLSDIFQQPFFVDSKITHFVIIWSNLFQDIAKMKIFFVQRLRSKPWT